MSIRDSMPQHRWLRAEDDSLEVLGPSPALGAVAATAAAGMRVQGSVRRSSSVFVRSFWLEIPAKRLSHKSSFSTTPFH